VALAGIMIGVIPPGPGPVDALMVALGCLSLSRKRFRAFECWAQQKVPLAHRTSTDIILRYLDDLEKRFPGSVPADMVVNEPAADAGTPSERSRHNGNSVDLEAELVDEFPILKMRMFESLRRVAVNVGR
jgi:hypothetical protein